MQITNFTTEQIELLNKNGIYLITHSNQKNTYYIGSTKAKGRTKNNKDGGFIKRWKQHLFKLKQNKHSSKYLQNVVNKYGIDGIKFNIIEILENVSNILDIEQKYITEYENRGKLFNCSNNVHNSYISKDSSKKRSIIIKNKELFKRGNHPLAKEIYLYDKYGNFIKQYNCITDVAEELNIPISNIGQCYKKELIFIKEYIFKKNPLTEEQKEYFKDNPARTFLDRCKPVEQFDLLGNLIATYQSASEVNRIFNIKNKGINQVLKRKNNKYLGYEWKYKKISKPF